MDDEQNTRAALQAVLARFIQEASLPDSVAFNYIRWYAGVTGSLAQRAKAANTAPLVGFSGCQGSGKSTLVALMAKVMREVHGVSTVVLSLDDFYLTKAARAALAESIHPLFATRGVPGTHDLALLDETIAALRQPSGAVPVPAFDKALDDRTEMVHWRQVSAPVQLILLEGWCVGLSPQQESELEAPINPMGLKRIHHWSGEVRSTGGSLPSTRICLAGWMCCCCCRRPVLMRYSSGAGSRSNAYPSNFTRITPTGPTPP